MQVFTVYFGSTLATAGQYGAAAEAWKDTFFRNEANVSYIPALG